ncbi:GNAT family N-acetyltransferase [Actinospica sp.]|jgi:GNAT superfamily N-acetyltransferase|uniref:GNAT family N-acetyltransferase n=1 Tax=Actinospica sp. TaxID=1872142 RepID=UPI002CCBF933|nr:GNAT family N-acetyltransferase [Actinospica sp.]HWG23469.1 GNAT family N-acetyltransferase [Actinospica sp.]
MTDFAIRAARPDEAAQLSALALRSKAHWGYDAAFLEASRQELTLSPEQIVHRRTQVAVSREPENDGRLLGFGTIEGEPPAGELGMLFVDPPAIGTGVGGALYSHLAEMALGLGFHRLTIAADPNAEPFYLAKGAVRIGGVPSGAVEGRVLPLLAVAL